MLARPQLVRVLASLFLLVAFTLPTNAQTQTFVIRQRDLPAFLIGRAMGNNLSNAMSSASELAAELGAAKIQLSVQVIQARKRFWDNYPNGPNRAMAEAEFARALLAKDMAYLLFYGPQGPYSVVGKISTYVGGEIDGGIPEIARTHFLGWIFKIWEMLGAANHAPDPGKGNQTTGHDPSRVTCTRQSGTGDDK